MTTFFKLNFYGSSPGFIRSNLILVFPKISNYIKRICGLKTTLKWNTNWSVEKNKIHMCVYIHEWVRLLYSVNVYVYFSPEKRDRYKDWNLASFYIKWSIPCTDEFNQSKHTCTVFSPYLSHVANGHPKTYSHGNRVRNYSTCTERMQTICMYNVSNLAHHAYVLQSGDYLITNVSFYTKIKPNVF